MIVHIPHQSLACLEERPCDVPGRLKVLGTVDEKGIPFLPVLRVGRNVVLAVTNPSEVPGWLRIQNPSLRIGGGLSTV